MNWIILAIGAHLCWAFVNLGDKYLVGHRIQNPYVYLMLLSPIAALFPLLAIPFVGFVVPELKDALLLLTAGLIWFIGGLPYIKAMSIEEPTRINIWWNTIPVFSLLIEVFVLGQGISQQEFLAFCILVIGAFIASIHIGKKLRFSKALWYMLLACLSFAIYATVISYVTTDLHFLHAYMWIGMGILLGVLCMFLMRTFRKQAISTLAKGDNILLGGIFLVSLFEIGGMFFNIKALSLAPASLVFAFEGTQVVFVFIIAGLLSVFAPKIIKEETDIKNIALKVVSIFIMIIGILLLAFT